MSLDDLRAFVAFVDLGSVSRAANRLFITQPALTRRLQRLESQIGMKLLDRSARPPRVSAFGLQVCERARAVLREAAGLKELALDDGKPRGTFRIGAVQSVSDAISLEALKLLKSRFPRLALEMRTDSTAELMRNMTLGQLDVAAVLLAPGATPPSSVEGTRIGAQRVRIVAGKRYPVASSVKLADLAEHPWVLYSGSCVSRDAIQRAMEGRGFSLQVAVSEHGLGVEPQLALVAAGAGLGYATEAMLLASRHKHTVRALRVSDLDIRWDIWIVCQLQPGSLAPAIRCFEEVVERRFGARRGTRKRA